MHIQNPVRSCTISGFWILQAPNVMKKEDSVAVTPLESTVTYYKLQFI